MENKIDYAPREGTILSEVDKQELKRICKFYSNDKYLNKLLEFIDPDNEGRMSLRTVDYFVTKYCRQHNVTYKIRVNGDYDIFNVYESYLTQINQDSKNDFDPFCRKKKIYIIRKLGKQYQKIPTSVGQLIFFKWAITYKVISFIQNHIAEIKEDQKKYSKKTKEAKKTTISTTNTTHHSTSNDPFDDDICSSEKLESLNFSSEISSAKKKNSRKKEHPHSIYTGKHIYPI
jgi:hypothetical protein